MGFTRIDIGFVPLTDAATLIAAQEMGFAAEEGLELVLHPRQGVDGNLPHGAYALTVSFGDEHGLALCPCV